jgi:hypothetical protein
LGVVDKIIKTYKHLRVENKTELAKRLAQCLNPELKPLH